MTDAFDFTRYLASKRSVDDRALNRHVWQTLADAVAGELPRDRPLRVLEVGAGIGTMVERCVEWGLFARSGFDVSYTAIDSEEGNIEVARRRLAHLTSGGEAGLRVRMETADLYEFATRRENRQRFDLIIANALLDLLHLPVALPVLLQMVRPAGLFYFSINFDGATLFLPEVDPELDGRVEALYHRSMDTRITDGQPSGDSRTGRRLFHALRACGAEVLAAGSSDWVVHAVGGGYPADEAYFLGCILHFVESTLSGHPELDGGEFGEWLALRRGQVARGELVYVAHQLDYCGRVGR
ncbi:MAG: methyltransferase domain-containing protein [Caldilineaceae bacterium]|nr:methyltransferase domain-containing protein [Caldilineaceae bacterium]